MIWLSIKSTNAISIIGIIIQKLNLMWDYYPIEARLKEVY